MVRGISISLGNEGTMLDMFDSGGIPSRKTQDNEDCNKTDNSSSSHVLLLLSVCNSVYLLVLLR